MGSTIYIHIYILVQYLKSRLTELWGFICGAAAEQQFEKLMILVHLLHVFKCAVEIPTTQN